MVAEKPACEPGEALWGEEEGVLLWLGGHEGAEVATGMEATYRREGD